MLHVIVDSLDGVPEGSREHYVERDGKFQLDLTGAFSQIDRDKLLTSLQAERAEHATTQKTLRAFGEFTPESVQTLSDSHAQLGLELKALQREGGPTKDDIEAQVEARITARIAPVQRDLDRAAKLNDELTGQVGTLSAEASRGNIQRTVLGAFQVKDLGTNPDARPDVELWAASVFEVDATGKVVSRDGVGVTPGLDPVAVFKDMRDQGLRRHWFGATVGADAAGGSSKTGGDGDNPFTLVGEGTSQKVKNFTAAAQLTRSDPARAKRLAKAAKAEIYFPHLFKE